jgi:hypothetical protein
MCLVPEFGRRSWAAQLSPSSALLGSQLHAGSKHPSEFHLAMVPSGLGLHFWAQLQSGYLY